MPGLLVPQRLDGVDAGGFHGRADAEDHAGGDRGGPDNGAPFGGGGDRPGEEKAEAGHTAPGREQHRLGRELADDVVAARAYSRTIFSDRYAFSALRVSTISLDRSTSAA